MRSSLKGRLILPSDHDYEQARRVGSFNPSTDRHPLMIAQCADPTDVSRVIDFAKDARLEIAVKAAGNDVLGESVCDKGVVVDLSRMKRITIEPLTRVARVEAGVLSRELNAAAGEHRLAPVLACHPDLGVTGLTLGGGLGWLIGTYGAACDHIVGAEIVCADGKLLRATAHENDELFWAIKGGGGNFGTVTSLDLRLAQVDQVMGGALVFRCDIAKFLRFYRDFMHAAPDALTVELSIFRMDEPLVMAIVCWNGDEASGARVLAPLRGFTAPIFDSVRQVSYAHLTDRPGIMQLVWTALANVLANPRLVMTAIGSMAGGAAPPDKLMWRGGSLDGLSEPAIEHLAGIVQSLPPGGRIGLGHFMHGEVLKLPREATPFVRRGGQFAYFIGASWSQAQEADSNMDWVRTSISKLRPLSSAGTYVNYLSDASEKAVAASYGENYPRLVSVKRKYDPNNIFRHNRNIRP